MKNIPAFTTGETVLITNPVDDFYMNKSGIVVGSTYRNYINESVYTVKLDNDGYNSEFTADELTAMEEVS